MPKLLKILRGRKSSSSSASVKKSSSKNRVFRRGANQRSGKSTSKEAEDHTPLVIAPTITFSLSEDETGSDIVHSPVSDIENQVRELIVGDAPDLSRPIEISTGVATKTIAVGTDDQETITFTHLQLMRNELAHMIQLAEKDEEIGGLRQINEELQISNEEIIQAKNEEIAKIKQLLQSVENALADAQDELESVNKEHSKVIEVLMKTQYELYELKHKSPSSWMSPVWSFFDVN